MANLPRARLEVFHECYILSNDVRTAVSHLPFVGQPHKYHSEISGTQFIKCQSLQVRRVLSIFVNKQFHSLMFGSLFKGKANNKLVQFFLVVCPLIEGRHACKNDKSLNVFCILHMGSQRKDIRFITLLLVYFHMYGIKNVNSF